MPARMAVRAVVAACAFLASGPAPANANLDAVSLDCQRTIAKEGARFVKGMLTLERQCRDANLRSGCGTCSGGGNAGEPCNRLDDCPDAGPGTACAGVACAEPDPGAVAKLVARLRDKLDRKCGAANLVALGFPGPCNDPDPPEFSVANLKDCIENSHRNAIDGICVGGSNDSEPCRTTADCPDSGPGTACLGLLDVEYDRRVCAPLANDRFVCQREIARRGSRFLLDVLRSVQRCRDRILGGTLTGVLPERCATDDAKTRDAIAKAKARTERQIARKCNDAMATGLYACHPDQSTVVGASCPVGVAGCDTCAAAAPCETCRHQAFADDPVAAEAPDLIDFEYPTPRTCGDQRVNLPGEECDGGSDQACPGHCGDPNGCFACLCTDAQRLRVVEHMNSDLDLGYSGLSHDASTPEGGGFLADLWDCDGPAGPDTVCTVGPSCSGGAHATCSPGPNQVVTGDSICQALGQGTCRKSAFGATGPHCDNDLQRRCDTAPDCPPGGQCIKTFHGAPVPLSAGSVSICSVNVLSEDVVGTADVATGALGLRIRQRSLVYGPGNLAEPCPVCGGFCAGAPNAEDRTRCTSDGDCPAAPHHCVTDLVCSYGANADEPCRVDPPYGGLTAHFGVTSVDCLPIPGLNISGQGLDIVFDPFTTGTSRLKADVPCVGFNGRACFGGPNDRVPCTTDSQCPLGECNDQCFCPSVQLPTAPNSCLAACFGGGNDAMPCDSDTECPGGFCHRADCRLNPADTDSCQEGVCPAGPPAGRCSVSVYKGCLSDAECHPPLCATCGAAETCQIENRACFLNGEIDRCGTPGVPDAVAAATFCIAQTGRAAIDSVSGLPGPGGLTQPLTTCVSGF